ncbi:hypothetical protein X777_07345, partial [Ooceraea biroi]
GKKIERIEEGRELTREKRRETWPTGSCSSRSASSRAQGATIKFGTRRKEAARARDFSRTSRRSSNVWRDQGRRKTRSLMDNDWSGKRNFSVRSTAIGVRRGSRGVERDAYAGGPLADLLGVSLRWGSGRAAEILSCNGVDVTPVERVQRWEDTLWKARLASAIAPLRIFGTCFSSLLPPVFPLRPYGGAILTPAKRLDGRCR